MTMPHRSTSSFGRLSGLAAAALFVAPLAVASHAEQGESFAVPRVLTHTQVPVRTAAPTTLNLDLQAALHAPLDLSEPVESSSSSETAVDPAVSSDRLNLMADPAGDGNMQPPPRRRRYGRPNYNDRFHNSDGSNRLAFVVGGGFNVPVGAATSNYLNVGYRFEVGAGINFNKKLGVMAQFDYDHFGIPQSILNNQEALYSNLDPTDAANGVFAGLGGNAHIWSFTLNPTYTFHQGEALGTYAVVGGGFYHKVTNFTLPTTSAEESPFGQVFEFTTNQNFDSYVSNAPGVTGGVGFTYKFSRFANQKLFGEVRYVHTFNSARLGDPLVTGASTGTPNNYYPPNSNESSYLPITFGIRF